MADKAVDIKAADVPVEIVKAEEPKQEEESVPFEESPVEEAAPEVKLVDIQAAVRELMKAKGKETAKYVLGAFQSKKGTGGASGASDVRPEDYAAALKMLKEAVDA